MIRHIVFWNLLEYAEGADWITNANILKTMLESLVGQIDGLQRAEVNLNYNPKGFDLCLLSEFDSKKALDNYKTHPRHMEIREFVHKIITNRVVTDCEIL